MSNSHCILYICNFLSLENIEILMQVSNRQLFHRNRRRNDVFFEKLFLTGVLQNAQTLIKKDIAAQYLPKIQTQDKNGLMLPEFLPDWKPSKSALLCEVDTEACIQMFYNVTSVNTNKNNINVIISQYQYIKFNIMRVYVTIHSYDVTIT